MEADSIAVLARAVNADDPMSSLAAAWGISKQAVHRKYGGRSLSGNQE
ncbi:hypothetical protein [Nonomuraea cavernae]